MREEISDAAEPAYPGGAPARRPAAGPARPADTRPARDPDTRAQHRRPLARYATTDDAGFAGGVLVIPALSRDLPSLQRQWRKAEVFREIAPRWIYLVDQIVFPCAGPTFDPLLPQDRRFHRFMTLKPHEPLDSIPLSKSSNEPLAVLHTRPGKSDVTPV